MRAPDLDEGHQGHRRQHVTRRRTRSSKRVRRGHGLQEPDCPAHVVEACTIVVAKAGAPPRPRTHVGQAGRQQPRRALHLWPRASGWSAIVGKGKPVEMGVSWLGGSQATHRTWLWAAQRSHQLATPETARAQEAPTKSTTTFVVWTTTKVVEKLFT